MNAEEPALTLDSVKGFRPHEWHRRHWEVDSTDLVLFITLSPMVPNSEQSSGLVWQQLESSRVDQSWFNTDWKVHRAKGPAGWLIIARISGGVPQGITFYPDPDHRWNGGSVA